LLIDFFLKLKSHKLPVSIKEYLTLLEAMDKKVIGQSVDEFYYLSRSALVKDEANFDKFDRAFAEFWQGVETIPGIETRVPLEWLLKQVELTLSEEEKKQIEALGGWEKLMETLKQRLEEQKGRHQGGAKWIGTAGTSPFGAYGYNPEGVRIGQERSRNRSAVKVWDRASTATSTTRSSSARGTSRSPCAGSESSPAKARRRNSTWKIPSTARRERPTSTSTCGRSAAMRSRC